MEACILAAEAMEEKVFVALPDEFKAGRSTLSWALNHFHGSGATIVMIHVHVPPQMIPVMGVNFHASKLSPEQVNLFRRIERRKVNKRLDEYVHQCSKMKVKCEKLVYEKEDVAAGLVELIVLHGITKLVIAAAADKHYSRKMEKPKSRTAIAVMQKADPSCKIWFVCKEQLICTRDAESEVAQYVTPLPTEFDHGVLHSSPCHEEDDIGLDFGFYDKLQEACQAAETLVKRALDESAKRQQADEEVVSSLEKAKMYEELYLKESQQRKEAEAALARANQEIRQLKQAMEPLKTQQDKPLAKHQEAIAEKSILEISIIDDIDDDLSTARYLLNLQQSECDHAQHEHDEMEALCNQRKLTEYSPSSVLPSSHFDEDCIPSYSVCPIFQEVMREPCIAADGFTYEADAIRGWLAGGREMSPMTDRPLPHYEHIPNLTLRSMIQDFHGRQRYPLR